jgi:hypothetical protein
MISCMIEELKYSNSVGGTRAGEDDEGLTKEHFSLTLLQNRELVRCVRTVKSKSNTRFPCTHKKEPVDFH